MSTQSSNEETIDDASIRKQLWEGSIPAVVNVPSDQITSFQQPFPYYVRNGFIEN